MLLHIYWLRIDLRRRIENAFQVNGDCRGVNGNEMQIKAESPKLVPLYTELPRPSETYIIVKRN